MGAAIASVRAGADLYEALDRWLTRVPGVWWFQTLVLVLYLQPLDLPRRLARLLEDGHPQNA